MFKARMRFSKTGNAKFISHLDTMRVFQRAFQRAGLPLRYTEGFNPHPYVSVLLPLSTSFEGLDELVDFDLSVDFLPDGALGLVNGALPSGFCAHEIYEAAAKPGEIAFVSYKILLFPGENVAPDAIERVNALFERDSVTVTKRTKNGESDINIIDYIHEIRALSENGGIRMDTTLCAGNKSLNPEYVVKAVERELCLKSPPDALYTRTSILNGCLEKFR